MSRLRILVFDGWLAYRGSSRVLTPAMFVPLVLVQPIAELVFFLKIGQYSGSQAAAFYVIGNALYGCAIGGLFTMVVNIAVERRNQTLVMLIASPASRILVFGSRMIPAFCIAMCTGLAELVAGCALSGLRPGAGQSGVLMLSLVTSAASACAFGLLTGIAGLRNRDVNFLGNLILSVCLLLSGADVPLSDFGTPVRVIAELLPMTLSIRAARAAFAGSGGVFPALAAEAGLTLGYVALAAVLLVLVERGARAEATLEIS
jgi:ABC-2 type transport system permease protein